MIALPTKHTTIQPKTQKGKTMKDWKTQLDQIDEYALMAQNAFNQADLDSMQEALQVVETTATELIGQIETERWDTKQTPDGPSSKAIADNK